MRMEFAWSWRLVRRHTNSLTRRAPVTRNTHEETTPDLRRNMFGTRLTSGRPCEHPEETCFCVSDTTIS